MDSNSAASYTARIMLVAREAAMTIVASGFLAIVVVAMPFVGLRSHPRASLVASVASAAIAVTAVAVHVAPLLGRREEAAYILTNYFLTMVTRLVGAPYPFFWTPAWAYAIGGLMPLIPAGAVLALATGYCARRAAARTAVSAMVVGCCLLLAYVAGAVYAAVGTWNGVPI